MYGDSSNRNASSVKFGSYDEFAIDPTFNRGKPKMFATVTTKAWSIPQNLFLFDQNQITGTYSVYINPGLPFIYVPDTVFIQVKSIVETNIKEFKCDASLNICKANMTCDQINKT